MIQQAHVGVGILGKEGNQAAQASDYHFSQFRFLARLILVHGRLNYYRTSYFINFFYFKNFLFSTTLFLFSFYSAYSGQSLYDEGYLINFNSIATIAAPIYYGAFEIDLSPENAFVYSRLARIYLHFKNKHFVSFSNFILWNLFAATIGVTVFFIIFNTQ